jgi:Fe-S-cluster containining protein
MEKGADQGSLQEEIRKTNFACRHCGTCCREQEPGSNIVMVSPAEVRRIMEKTGLSFEDIAGPYPDMIREGDKEYTFDWVLLREGDRCIFWRENRCAIYEARPWICRTYPFMLDQRNLRVFPCTGIRSGTGSEMDQETATGIMTDLEDRLSAELKEEASIRCILAQATIPSGKKVVIDGEGMKILPQQTW